MATEIPLSSLKITSLIETHVSMVFSTMLDLEIERQQDAFDVHPETVFSTGPSVIALLSFTGQWSGTGMIQCSDALARLISSRLFLTDFPNVTDEVLDALGEVANMIIGNFKEDAAPELGPVQLGTPTVLSGDHFQARMWQGHQWTDILFRCGKENFQVKVCLVNQRSISSDAGLLETLSL